VLARAREGLFVVRLKAGDPLVFGRGGEEAEELAAAGIPFEIVPGITAALGAASYSGIPLTHRGLAAQVVISTGQHAKGRLPAPEPLAGSTLVLYMAARDLAFTLAGLVARGWAPSTPAAVVLATTTADESTITGTLADLAAHAEGVRRSKLPALVFVGGVVAMRESITWRTQLPLVGRRVIIARARSGPSRIGAALRTLGADVVELPHVERDIHVGAAWLSALENIDRYGAIVVASEEAAEVLSSAEPQTLGRLPPIVAIGSEAASLLRASGISASVTVTGACADALQGARHRLCGQRVLVPVTDHGRSSLMEDLIRLGAFPEVVVIAHERRIAPARWPSRIDLVVLPASSAAEGLYRDAPEYLRKVPAVAIGARTQAMARRLGVAAVVVAEADTKGALIDACLSALAPSASPPWSSVPNAAHRLSAQEPLSYE
jgi:uroporphyrinogen III methyltransferase/synthase